MVLRYSSVSIAAAVMIARLSDQTVAHASSSISDTGYEWACEDTAEAHHLHLYEIRTPIRGGESVANEATREKVASVYIADSCAGKFQCERKDYNNYTFVVPKCQRCCHERWALFGKEFIEALDRADWDHAWADKIASCAFVPATSANDMSSVSGWNRPAKEAAELTPAQVKALGDLNGIVDEINDFSDFNEADDMTQERILERASVIFAETFIRVKRDELQRVQARAPMDDQPEKLCRGVYEEEFPSIQQGFGKISPAPLESFRMEETFFSPRFSLAEEPSKPVTTQSSLAFLWDLGHFGKIDHGESSRQHDAPGGEPAGKQSLDSEIDTPEAGTRSIS